MLILFENPEKLLSFRPYPRAMLQASGKRKYLIPLGEITKSAGNISSNRFQKNENNRVFAEIKGSVSTEE